jgi:ribose transport system permease protein
MKQTVATDPVHDSAVTGVSPDEAPRHSVGTSSPKAARLSMAELAPKSAIPFLLVASFVLFSILTPDLFFTWTNVRIMIGAQATILLLGVAATIPLRAGDFDLSISAVMVGSACLVGVLYAHGQPPLVCCVAAIALGIVVGAVNGLFVVGFGLGSLIVTLGMLTLLSGITSYLTKGVLVVTIPDSLRTFSNHTFLTLPLVVWIGWTIAAAVWFVFELTPLGRYLLFLGGNPAAAALAGLRVSRLRSGAFITSSVIAAVAGVLLAGTLGAVDPASSGAYLLPPFTAAFLGTTTIQLGRFNVVGTVVGLYLLAVGITGLQLLGAQGWVSDVFNGAALILAIAFAKFFDFRVRSRKVAEPT